MRYSNSESNTLSRRYELPTCLLEVWTERSPLSDWQSQIVAQNLHFRLRLNQSRKTIKGDQQQITNLIEVVTAYCDRWLAQDNFDTLDHAIAVPKLTKLQLSTLQLFDLYESLELCANEFVILPNVVLEARRLYPDWLKIVAGAIAIVGVSVGAIRLVSFPSSEQPSYQIAVTPDASEKASIPPAASSEDKSENISKIAPSPKSANPINPINPSFSKAKPNAAIAPIPSQPQTDRDRKPLEKTDKVAIAPEPNISESSNRQRVADNLPSAFGDPTAASPTIQSRRLEIPSEIPNKDASQPATVTTESLPSAKPPIPSASSRAANDNIATNIKVLQIQSELSSDITTALVRYIQDQQITLSETGTIAFNLEISGDRVSNISTDSQVSTLKDNNAIAELEKIILNWRSPNPVTGKIRLVLQLNS
jgi:hypothetical protein